MLGQATAASHGGSRPAAGGSGASVRLSDPVFHAIRTWVYDTAGINLSDQKRALIIGRLAPRLRHFGLADYGEYLRLLRDGEHPEELQVAIDLLTTNETHFFREPKHFDFLREKLVAAHPAGRTLRVWSAACSSGEEPYSIAMTLAAALGEAPWEVLASDLSSRVLERARSGHYPMERAKTIPRPYLLRYCLKGVGAQEGTFLVEPSLRRQISFAQINLVAGAMPPIRQFDLIFLRNVLIYFDVPTKRAVLARVLPHLAAGGHLVVGHSESLHGVDEALKAVKPSIYRLP